MTINVTQLMASGAGGGAQVHVQNLVERLDHDRFNVEVISLSGRPCRSPHPGHRRDGSRRRRG